VKASVTCHIKAERDDSAKNLNAHVVNRTAGLPLCINRLTAVTALVLAGKVLSIAVVDSCATVGHFVVSLPPAPADSFGYFPF
jgi:hypothetical protein